MQNLKILNKKQIKLILKKLEAQFGFKDTLDFVFLQNREGKIFLINKDIAKVDLSKLRINSIGLYFGKIEQDELRLSIEGSQLIGKKAKKNIVELNSQQLKQWLKGEDIENNKHQDFVIIRHNKDFLGTGKAKQDKILNFVPKARRIKI